MSPASVTRAARRCAVLALLTIVAAACGGAGGSPTSSAPSSVTTAADVTTSSEAPPVELTLGSGSFHLDDPGVGLAALDSFVATLTVSFEGTRDGQPNAWSVVHEMRHRADPLATVIAVESIGDTPSADPSLMAEADGARYEVGADGACSGTRADPGDLAFRWMEPARRLDAVLGAEPAGEDTIEGIAAAHFTFDERAVGLFGIAPTSGELWLAAQGGYVVRYQRTTTGDADYFGEGVEGTLVWDYALAEVNQPIDLAFPPGCRVDLPMLPDAANVLNLPRWLSFDTSSGAAEVADFYQQALAALGWDVVLAPDASDTVAVLQFASGDENLFIAVGPSDLGSRVDIIIQPAT